jgi:hypothetical protein
MHSRTCGRLLVIEPLRALARNKLRSSLAMLGITFAVATSIWVSAIGSAGSAKIWSGSRPARATPPESEPARME